MRLPVRPRKKFAQHFMTSPRDLSAIAGALDICPGEKVLEIGPGAGALTAELLSRGAEVIAVEKDPRLADFLKKKESPAGSSLRIIRQDILTVDIQKDLPTREPVKVAGNIPYNITSPILEWLITQRPWVTVAVLTVQWEVAQRLAAKPGGKDWGSLSVFLQLYTEVTLLHKIDKSHFYPPPKVDSGILKLTFLKTPRFALKDEAFFFSLVRRAFQKRRKTLLNALADKKDAVASKKTLAAALGRLNIDPKRRPETLTLREWANLSESLGTATQK